MTGVSINILLNLGIRNIQLSLPTLRDQYSTGPFEVILTIIDTITINTPNINMSAAARTKSKIRITDKARLKYFVLDEPSYSFISQDEQHC